ncbi:hypothetical protein SRO_3637 [Streptomyces rochei]|nr:hypothetical protein SRO_3637 [Streptomyces rochei]
MGGIAMAMPPFFFSRAPRTCEEGLRSDGGDEDLGVGPTVTAPSQPDRSRLVAHWSCAEAVVDCWPKGEYRQVTDVAAEPDEVSVAGFPLEVSV